LHIFGPEIFLWEAPEFWDLDHKTEHTSKFHDDRPRELKDLWRNKKEKKNKHQQ